MPSSKSTALFRGPPADVRFSQEVIRGDADRIQLAAAQQWSRAAEAEAFANSTLRSATAVVLACLSAKLEVVVTEMISCPNGCRSTRGTSRRIPHGFRIGGAQLAMECLEAA